MNKRDNRLALADAVVTAIVRAGLILTAVFLRTYAYGAVEFRDGGVSIRYPSSWSRTAGFVAGAADTSEVTLLSARNGLGGSPDAELTVVKLNEPGGSLPLVAQSRLIAVATQHDSFSLRDRSTTGSGPSQVVHIRYEYVERSAGGEPRLVWCSDRLVADPAGTAIYRVSLRVVGNGIEDLERFEALTLDTLALQQAKGAQS